MKKSIYTLAFIATFQFVSQAQTHDQTKPKEPAKQEKVNPDGTLAPAESKSSDHKASDPQKKETAPEGTRSAITEKGVPASKGSATKTSKGAQPKTEEPAKTEKK